MIKTSETIESISEALAKAQQKFGAAIKSSQNPAFRSRYADLSAVIDATLEHLNSEGIVCMQHPSLTYVSRPDGSAEAMITVTTRLLHKTGQWIESDLSIPAVQRDRFDAQSCGSAMTYACRYALQSICVVPREDDDGNEATGRGTQEAANKVAQQKIAVAAKAGNKTALQAQERNHVPIKVDTLLYTFPPRHNGNKAEFLNVSAYIESNQDREHEVRFAFSAAGPGGALVPADKLPSLLNVLVGDLGINVKKVEAA